jgi:hypothetical protein
MSVTASAFAIPKHRNTGRNREMNSAAQWSLCGGYYLFLRRLRQLFKILRHPLRLAMRIQFFGQNDVARGGFGDDLVIDVMGVAGLVAAVMLDFYSMDQRVGVPTWMPRIRRTAVSERPSNWTCSELNSAYKPHSTIRPPTK